MTKRYGTPLFRIPISVASSCPHGRCTFCPDRGARAQQILRQDTPAGQIEAAIRFATRRYRAKKFMLYVQAFTADLTDPAQQESILTCLHQTRFEALTIGTRPDCLTPPALDFLLSIASSPSAPELWIEPGIQSLNDATLKRIHRGHDAECARQAVREAAGRGLLVAPHVILGLPGEESADWNHTAQELARLPIHGIKIHNLHIIKGTPLAEQYHRSPFHLLGPWHYAEALIDFLRRIPAEIPVLRLITDTPAEDLIAPRDFPAKGAFTDLLLRLMTMREVAQGDLCPNHEARTASEPRVSAPAPVPTNDGSITFFSEEWKEHFHTRRGARLEAMKKFVEPSGLIRRLKKTDCHVLDVCFGTGLNSLEALRAASSLAPDRYTLHITGLEIDKRIVRAAAHQILRDDDPLDWPQATARLLQEKPVRGPGFDMEILWGDARHRIRQIESSTIDLIYHDPFSTQHCPELWTVEFFQQLRRVLKPDGLLLTYSCAQPVRGAMRAAGLRIAQTVPGFEMGNGTAAARRARRLHEFDPIVPLDPRRGIPFRDPHQIAPSKVILRTRQQEIERTPVP